MMRMTERAAEPSAEEIILAYQRDVWRFVVALGCTPIEADDVVQETFLKVLRGRFEYRGEAETRAFLFTVAKGLFISTVRRRKRSPLVANLDDADADWARFVEEARPDLRVDAMLECLQGIDGRSYRTLMMRYRDDRRLDEIAADLGLAQEGARSLLRRLKDRLRECVERKLKRDE